MPRYWIGGATGFLGSHLLAQLVEQGHELVAVSRGGGHVGSTRVDAVDVLDPDAVARSASGCAGAFLATGVVSRDPELAEEQHRLHVTGTARALDGLARAGVPRVVVASTSGTIAIGEDPKRVFSEDDPAPLELIARFPYYRSKYYGEQSALERSRDGFEVVVVNPSLLLGPGDHRESSTGDVRKFLERAIPATPSGGIAFVDARDAALGMRLAFEKGRAGERYLLNAKNMTLAAFFQRLERLTGVKAPLVRLPRSPALALGIHHAFKRAVELIGGEPPVDDVSAQMAQLYWYASSEKAERELGWLPRDPADTLRDTVRDLVARRVVVSRSLTEAFA